MSKDPHLFIFGPGFTGRAVAQKALQSGFAVSGTYRDEAKARGLASMGISPVLFGSPEMGTALKGATHWLVSVAPGQDGDPVLDMLKSYLGQLNAPKWIGYLSSTNVYGDHGGAWVDETTNPSPSLERGKRRVVAEQAWQELALEMGAKCHIFRLAGIYGPGRNAVKSLLTGKARRIIKPGQLFSRIHVEDIAEGALLAMTQRPESGVFNLADDMPCPPQDVIADAAALLGVEPPEEVPFDKADLSPMARSFYQESKRVKNDRVKNVLGLALKYPSYKEALPELVRYEMDKTQA